jgi:hypothetical protein
MVLVYGVSCAAYSGKRKNSSTSPSILAKGGPFGCMVEISSVKGQEC